MNSIEILLFADIQSTLKMQIIKLGIAQKDYKLNLKPVIEDIIAVVKSETGFELKIIKRKVKANDSNNKENR